MNPEILICTDLDRTLLPNGFQSESAGVREYFYRLAQLPHIKLAYVSGRHLALVEQAIEEYRLPLPDYAVTDVGSCIYQRQPNDWQLLQSWHDDIAPDWQGYQATQLRPFFDGLEALQLQPADKQSRYKLSYFVELHYQSEPLLQQMQQRLQQQNIQASLIWSIDEQLNLGLLDVLPPRGNKLHAIEFLQQREHIEPQHLVFAGDSGNDLEVMASPLASILVANASNEVKQQALRLASEHGHPSQLYIARGGLHHLNGNYAAGILEGLAYFIPELEATINTLILETL